VSLRAVSIALTFRTMAGTPIPHEALTTIRKLLSVRIGGAVQLFAHGDPSFIRGTDIDTLATNSDPVYEARMEGVPGSVIRLGVQIDIEGETFEIKQNLGPVSDRIAVEVSFEGIQRQITRSSADPRSQALGEEAAASLGVDRATAAAVLAIANFGAEDDPPLDPAASPVSVTEPLLVPTGGLVLTVRQE
jgi:hypothetical protein